MTQAVNLAALGSAGVTTGFKNRVINGAMNIDQRHAGNSFSGTNGGSTSNYIADRFDFRVPGTGTATLQQVVDAPAGFYYSSKLTVTGTYTLSSLDYGMIQYSIEGYDASDFAWGTSSAQTLTLSFWVKASVAGSYCVTFFNSSANKVYPVEYTLTSNVWTKVVVSVPGDTSAGTAAANGTGLSIRWGYGAGSSRVATPNTWSSGNTMGTTNTVNIFNTNGATFQLTGVQLESGTTATTFETRPAQFELALCQRYFQKSYNYSQLPGATGSGDDAYFYQIGWGNSASGIAGTSFPLPVQTAVAPTMTVYDCAGNAGRFTGLSAGAGNTNNVSFNMVNASQTKLTFRTYANSYNGMAFGYKLEAEI